MPMWYAGSVPCSNGISTGRRGIPASAAPLAKSSSMRATVETQAGSAGS